MDFCPDKIELIDIAIQNNHSYLVSQALVGRYGKKVVASVRDRMISNFKTHDSAKTTFFLKVLEKSLWSEWEIFDFLIESNQCFIRYSPTFFTAFTETLHFFNEIEMTGSILNIARQRLKTMAENGYGISLMLTIFGKYGSEADIDLLTSIIDTTKIDRAEVMETIKTIGTRLSLK